MPSVIVLVGTETNLREGTLAVGGVPPGKDAKY